RLVAVARARPPCRDRARLAAPVRAGRGRVATGGARMIPTQAPDHRDQTERPSHTVKIAGARTIVVGTPWRELVFVELLADSGLVGVGEIRIVNKTATLVACIEELAPRYIVGADPFDVER